MDIGKVRRFLQDGGIVYLYALFIAGYFLLPMAAGHRRFYYILVLPAVLVLWRDLAECYRGNALAGLVLLYAGYMMSTLAWTADFAPANALWALWYSLNVVTFVMLSGYLLIRYPRRVWVLARYAVWLAAGAALVSTVVWYLQHPFPTSRLEPLGVMHHPNKSGCAYGLFLVLAIHFLIVAEERRERLLYAILGTILLCLVILTQSRTALAGVCAGLLALAGFRALGLIAGALAASWALLMATPDLWQERVLSLSYRPGIWQQVLGEARGHLLFGQGYLVDTVVPAYGREFSHAHNSYLATLRDGGVVGLALLLAVLALAVRWGWELRHRFGEKIYLALLLYGVTCVAMDFDRLLVHPKEIWLFFWLPVALIMTAWVEGQRAAAVPASEGSER